MKKTFLFFLIVVAVSFLSPSTFAKGPVFNEFIKKGNVTPNGLYSAIKNTDFWVYVQINGPKNFAFVTSENTKTGKQTVIASQEKEPIKQIVLSRKLPKTNIISLSGDELLEMVYPDTEISFLIDNTNIGLSIDKVNKLKQLMSASVGSEKKLVASELSKILNHCKKVGFYRCEDKFEGTNRGIFHTPIERQRLKITEEELKQFIAKNYKNEVFASFFKVKASLTFDTDKEFDITQFTNNIKYIQDVNKDGSIYKLTFNEAPPLAVVNVHNTYKIGILPEQDKEFIKSKYSGNARLMRLKTNILRYHMKEAEMLNLDRKTFQNNIDEAIAAIVYELKKDETPSYIKKLIKKDFKEVYGFYTPLNTDEKIIKKIKELNRI